MRRPGLLRWAAAAWLAASSAQAWAAGAPAESFSVRTFDGLDLPARLTHAAGPRKKLLLFINGSTPSDETGYQAATFDAAGRPYRERHDIYARFLAVMPARGYAMATLAKRSYVYPHRLPRPSLDDFALDVLALIGALKSRALIRDEADIVIVGYSEGSVVASKVLGLMKRQPAGCVLLGSATGAFDFMRKPWTEWPPAEAYRLARGWSDERIQREYERARTLALGLRDIDEAIFENVWKKDDRLGLAPWESFHVVRELRVYDPVPNLLESGTPLLICVGDRDTSMPLGQTRETYARLRASGHERVTLRPIENEVHQYRRYEVFLIVDAWIASSGRSADFVPSAEDQAAIKRANQLAELLQEIANLPYTGELAKATDSLARARVIGLDDARAWFKLGLIMADGRQWDDALSAFQAALDNDYGAPHAALTWAGHVCDVRGDRQAAIEWYRKALAAYNGVPVRQDQFGIVLDRAWIERRLAEPYTGPPKRDTR